MRKRVYEKKRCEKTENGGGKMENKIEKFEDLEIWKESMHLTLEIYTNFTIFEVLNFYFLFFILYFFSSQFLNFSIS